MFKKVAKGVAAGLGVAAAVYVGLFAYAVWQLDRLHSIEGEEDIHEKV